MIKKRNKFLTVVFSFLPGAGHMYMGFFKTGVCLMSAFCLLCFLASWLNIGPLLFIAPVLWFYSFFDAINKMSLSDEEFYSLEDHYLFSLDSFSKTSANSFFIKNKLYFGVALIILGGYIFFRELSSFLYLVIPYDSFAYGFIHMIINMIPQLIITGVIIFAGIRLIISKKNEGSDE